jgi:hypothetical protein
MEGRDDAIVAALDQLVQDAEADPNAAGHAEGTR